uniref:Uncharacterized protein n=1 Tax=Timema poppense TaxID=170557 RepID=A0A7R9HFC5_TIMPO|nr:unnamed protein product [Timema poppensis]
MLASRHHDQPHYLHLLDRQGVEEMERLSSDRLFRRDLDSGLGHPVPRGHHLQRSQGQTVLVQLHGGVAEGEQNGGGARF